MKDVWFYQEGYTIQQGKRPLFEVTAQIKEENENCFEGHVVSGKTIDKNPFIVQDNKVKNNNLNIQSEYFNFNGEKDKVVEYTNNQLYGKLLLFADSFELDIEDVEVFTYPQNSFFLLEKARCNNLRPKGARKDTVCNRFLGWTLATSYTGITYCDRCKKLTVI